jgi:hypothetical protein
MGIRVALVLVISLASAEARAAKSKYVSCKRQALGDPHLSAETANVLALDPGGVITVCRDSRTGEKDYALASSPVHDADGTCQFSVRKAYKGSVGATPVWSFDPPPDGKSRTPAVRRWITLPRESCPPQYTDDDVTEDYIDIGELPEDAALDLIRIVNATLNDRALLEEATQSAAPDLRERCLQQFFPGTGALRRENYVWRLSIDRERSTTDTAYYEIDLAPYDLSYGIRGGGGRIRIESEFMFVD